MSISDCCKPRPAPAPALGLGAATAPPHSCRLPDTATCTVYIYIYIHIYTCYISTISTADVYTRIPRHHTEINEVGSVRSQLAQRTENLTAPASSTPGSAAPPTFPTRAQQQVAAHAVYAQELSDARPDLI